MKSKDNQGRSGSRSNNGPRLFYFYKVARHFIAFLHWLLETVSLGSEMARHFHKSKLILSGDRSLKGTAV